MGGYPKGKWCSQSGIRIEPLEPGRHTLSQRFLLWRIRREANTKNNLNVFMVFMRMGDIFLPYLLFMRRIMFKGKIPRIDKERIILRTAWRLGCVYEWSHHFHRGAELGITQDEINGIARDESATWTERNRALYHAADELIEKKNMSATAWMALTQNLSEDQCVEFCMLVGHYIMVAITINNVGIQIEPEFKLK